LATVGCLKEHLSLGHYRDLVRGPLQPNSKSLIRSHTALSANLQPDSEQNPDNNLNNGEILQAEPPENTAIPTVGRIQREDGEDDDGDEVTGPAVEASVVLAKTYRMRL
jgi:hypothetical protein